MKRSTPLILALVVGGTLAQTQAATPLTLNLVMSLVKNVTVNGKVTEQLTPAPKSVLPGDVLSQVVTVTNTGKIVQRGSVVRLPVPASTVYLAPEKGMAAARTEYSIDGGKTFSANPKRKVTVTENGKSVTREVPAKPNEYQSVRWTVPELAPGQSLKLGYRIQVK